jgi:hypothetical protein
MLTLSVVANINGFVADLEQTKSEHDKKLDLVSTYASTAPAQVRARGGRNSALMTWHACVHVHVRTHALALARATKRDARALAVRVGPCFVFLSLCGFLSLSLPPSLLCPSLPPSLPRLVRDDDDGYRGGGGGGGDDDQYMAMMTMVTTTNDPETTRTVSHDHESSMVSWRMFCR